MTERKDAPVEPDAGALWLDAARFGVLSIAAELEQRRGISRKAAAAELRGVLSELDQVKLTQQPVGTPVSVPAFAGLHAWRALTAIFALIDSRTVVPLAARPDAGAEVWAIGCALADARNALKHLNEVFPDAGKYWAANAQELPPAPVFVRGTTTTN